MPWNGQMPSMTEDPSCQFLPPGACRLLLRCLALAPVALPMAASDALAQSDRFERAWPDTDFSRLTVDLAEVISGGRPRDALPAILDATFIPALGRDAVGRP